MFARLLRFQIKIDKIDEATNLFKESVIPLCKNQKGYKGSFFLVDRETAQCIPITLWESEDDMMATEHSRFFQEQLVKFMDFFVGPTVRETYEVVIED